MHWLKHVHTNIGAIHIADWHSNTHSRLAQQHTQQTGTATHTADWHSNTHSRLAQQYTQQTGTYN